VIPQADRKKSTQEWLGFFPIPEILVNDDQGDG
jgi:hypothetical protein